MASRLGAAAEQQDQVRPYQLIEVALDECSLRGCGRISSPSAVVVLVSTRRFYPRCQMRHGGGGTCLRQLAVLARAGPGAPPSGLD